MEKLLRKYAELVIKVGVNLKQGEELVINSPITASNFARIIAEEAYKVGAKRVTVFWSDEQLSKINFTYEDVETLTDIPKWLVESRNYVIDKKAAYISIVSDDPEIFMDVDPDKLSATSRATRKAMKRFGDAAMTNEIKWNVIAYPHLAWAKMISPDLSDDQAMAHLWSLIIKAMRLDVEDSVGAWKAHQDRLKSVCKTLNNLNIKTLRYKNSIGTNFSIDLPKDYYFTGSSELSKDGVEFTANMPTEEVFTAPHRLSANGKVVASMPLFYNGNRIEDFWFIFKDGKVIDFDAKIGKDILTNLLDTDNGSKYLGEVALVEYDSPIQKLNTLFYDTLFDENASCHFALGKAYPCIKNSENLSLDELLKAGINESLEHVDFMIGTHDLNIVAIDYDGKETQIFEDGNFVI
ncbi:MAG: aminopeptidase [Christensenellales bacterium]|nr:aminopeptidase [Clostridiales bacterium]